MRLEHLNESISNNILYHVGPDFDRFDVSKVGTGEGHGILGPGIYFVDNVVIAKRYESYVMGRGNAILYTVRLNRNANIADPIQGSSPMIMEKFVTISKELGYDHYRDLPMGRSLDHGRGTIGSIVRVAGKREALKLFLRYGIDGAMEVLPGGNMEYAIFNPDVINIISKEVLSEDD